MSEDAVLAELRVLIQRLCEMSDALVAEQERKRKEAQK